MSRRRRRRGFRPRPAQPWSTFVRTAHAGSSRSGSASAAGIPGLLRPAGTGAIGFYGRPGVGGDGTPGPTQRAAELQAPILALQAGADQNNTAGGKAALPAGLAAAGGGAAGRAPIGGPHHPFLPPPG